MRWIWIIAMMPSFSLAVNCPIYKHENPAVNEEFKHLCSGIEDNTGNVPGPFGIAVTGDFSADSMLQIGPGANRHTRVSLSTAIHQNVSGHGYGDYSTFSPPSTTNLGYAAFETQSVSSGTTDINHIAGFQSNGGHYSAGTASKLYGFYSLQVVGPGAGAVANIYDYYASESSVDPTAAGVSAHVGFFAESMSAADENYSFYAVDAPAYFGGGVRSAGGSNGHAMCWSGDTLGYCTSAVASDGTCTCQ